MAPAIRENGIKFQIWPNDHDPPHVHVHLEGETTLINLLTDEFMIEPPKGKGRAIMAAYQKHREALLRMWEELHGQ